MEMPVVLTILTEGVSALFLGPSGRSGSSKTDLEEGQYSLHKWAGID